MESIYKYKLFFIYLILLFNPKIQCQNERVHVYLFPGQGSDQRIFEKIEFPEYCIVENIIYPIPGEHSSLKDFALQLSDLIDTSGYTILIGVSFGGMICTEINNHLPIEKVILLSSAKCRNELPFRYKFQKYIPVYKVIPKTIIKKGALVAQPIVEPDRKKEKETFVDMLKRKDPQYMKRTVGLIVNWEGETVKKNIIHIHGSKDHTLPDKRIQHTILIEGGSHMMTLTRGEEINKIINFLIEHRHL